MIAIAFMCIGVAALLFTVAPVLEQALGWVEAKPNKRR